MAKQSFFFSLLFALLGVLGVASCTSSDPTAPSTVAPPTDPGAGDDDGGAGAHDSGKKDDPSSCASTCKGCCDGERCIGVPSATQCGTFGAACKSCAGSPDGHSCFGGSCGCNSQSECGPGTVCDPDQHVCAKACSASSPCATGCCGANGLCQKGNDAKTCGGSGTCLDCSADVKGHACVAGGCGCNAAADCPYAQACDTTTHTCTASCSDSQPCNSACCSGGTCSTSASVCAGNPDGTTCVSSKSKCGCYDSSECPTGMACDTKTYKCTTACSATQNCNGGCCNAGTCAPGTTDAICGAVPPGYVGTCSSCAASPIGGHCSSGGFGYKCGGCATNAECNAPAICQGHCCLPKGGIPDALHPEQCCSDVIVNGACY